MSAPEADGREAAFKPASLKGLRYSYGTHPAVMEAVAEIGRLRPVVAAARALRHGTDGVHALNRAVDAYEAALGSER